MQIRNLCVAAAVLGAALSAQSPLTTTYAGGNGLTGGNTMMWFDLQVNTQVTINQIDINAYTGSTASSIDIYTIAGGHAGFETNQAAWTFQGNVPVTTINPMGTPTPCVLTTPFVLAPGIHGVAINYNAGLGQAYTNGPLGTFSTAELTFIEGGSGSTWGGIVNTPRVFNGSIYYSAASGFATQAPFGAGCPARSSVAVYELFPNTTFDLSNSSLLFLPNGNGSYTIIPGTNQWFAGFTNNLGLTDDSTATVTLPYPFPHAGGTTSTVSPSSNGFLWLASSVNSACCSGTVSTFLSDPIARIASCWMDLNPTSGGGVYADLDPSTGEFVITWSQVPEYSNTNVMDMQIALQPTGIFEIRYGANNTNTTHVALAGYSMGGNAVDPGNSDLSTVVTQPIVTGNSATPLTLAASARPTLGTSINLNTGSIPGGSILGVNMLGFVQHNPGIDLTGVGAPGCALFLDPAAKSIFLVSGSSSTMALPIPNITSLAGVHAFSQSVTFSSGFNTLGVIFSNGVNLGLDVN